MTIKELLFQEIESTPEELLKETLDFLQFLKTKRNIQDESEFPSAHSLSQIETQTNKLSNTNQLVQTTGQTLLEHLKTIGIWEGDDAQLCLEKVYASRGKARFDRVNPFDE
jgi:hypothetical protein